MLALRADVGSESDQRDEASTLQEMSACRTSPASCEEGGEQKPDWQVSLHCFLKAFKITGKTYLLFDIVVKL
jgi:hypothetical protein